MLGDKKFFENVVECRQSEQDVQKPLVSVLVPICNVQKYLGECLESLRCQSFADFEVICIDDGSTDRSPEIIEEYMEKDSRFRAISKENTGYGDSMNQGFREAKGKYIAILEGDDRAHQDMLLNLYTAVTSYEVDVAVANYYIYYQDEDRAEINEVLCKLPYGQILTREEQEILACATPSIWKGMYRKEYLISKKLEFLPTPGASYQDASFAFKTYMAADKIIAIKEAVLYYRRGHVTASVQDTSKVFCICDEFAEIRRYIEENGCSDWYPSYAQCLLERYYWNYNRLAGTAKKEFWERFKLELGECLAKGWIGRERVLLRNCTLFKDI